MILSKLEPNCTSPHFACITLGPKARNLERKPGKGLERYSVVGRWNYLREDIINYKSMVER